MIEPETDVDWQEAADAAHGALVLDAAREYGFVTGGPKVNVERCERVLSAAKTRGITPARDAVERFAKELR